MKLNFTGDQALILGGSSDIGISLAECMIKSAIFPWLTYRNQKGLRIISKGLESFEGKYKTLYLDFSNRDSLESLSHVLEGHMDFLIDLVHGDYESLIASADEEKVYNYFSENVSFRAEVLKRITRSMLKNKKGRLVFISSSAAPRPNPGQGFYAAAKLASEALYKNLGLELGGHGITTVTLRPGYVDAGRGKTFIQMRCEEVIKKTPIKRALNNKEVAETILFYLSDSARGFNATEIALDGGLTAGK
ncbi:MAG: SDR family oxidoreductase [Desulfobacterales bacterium]|nr:SDR family oxidoreductase [Desulfobacterales bacterium]